MNVIKHLKTILGVIVVLFVLSVIASVALSSLNSARSGDSLSLNSGMGNAPETAYDYSKSDSLSYNKEASVIDGGGEFVETRQIIKTGSLALVVEDVEVSADKVVNVAKKYSGLVSNVDISESDMNKKRGSITIRVPNNSFELAIKEVKAIANKVTREYVNTQDVTEEYADLQAQLKNKRAVEQQYLETLKKAWSIEDVLKVQERLDRTRGDIERLEGRITYMERQVNMSTISISLVSESEVAVLGVVWNPLTKIKQAAYNTLEDVVSFVYFIINLIFVIPVILVWVATIGGLTYVGWRVVLWVKRRLSKPSI